MRFIVIPLIIIIAVVVIDLIFSKDEDDLDCRETILDRDYEKRFIYAVSRVDKGNINWTLEALRKLRDGYNHYQDNDVALSILRVLEKGVQENNPTVIRYIRNCCRNL